MGNTILNIAGGKIEPIGLENFVPYFLIDVDTMYYDHTDPAIVEQNHKHWKQIGCERYKISEDIFTFLERTTLMFDRIVIYRFLEHVSMDRVLYFIYLLSTVTKPGSIIDIIVPNYEILAHMILSERPNVEHNLIDFEAHNIVLTTELLNEPSCPHASIWTEYRARYFFGLENRFKIKTVYPEQKFDGRDVYLRFFAERI